ncbi:transposase [Candidatus Kaiserbacteria bacterium]|nr:transposase [Candidatus Kaiserbacteria bacterium]
MLSLPSVVRIYLHAAPVNLHYAFDRLANIVREEMGQDPLSGHLFVFRNRRGDRVLCRSAQLTRVYSGELTHYLEKEGEVPSFK